MSEPSRKYENITEDVCLSLMTGYKKSPSGCWEWQGRLSIFGYGVLYIPGCQEVPRGHNAYAHRISWISNNGQIQDRHALICHKCDNKKCINPDHLFLGDSRANVLDAYNKGLAKSGEGHPAAKLKAEQVREILSAPNKRGVGKALARKFGVSKQLISAVRKRHIWQRLGAAS